MVHDFSPMVVGLRIAATLTILSLCAACKPSPPLAASPPPPTARPAITPAPTLTPQAVVPHTVALAVPTEQVIVSVTDRAAVLPSLTPFNLQPATACCDAPTELIIGASVGGRPLTVWQFASSAAGSSGAPRALLLVGGIHGGYEANTITLMHQLIDYFGDHPDAIPAAVRLLIIPAANPDGAAVGVGLDARFNGHGVDLNRNWGCGWASAAYWRDERVNPGAAAFSEPETQALARFIRQERPAAALFFHSAANGVFAGDCDGDHGSAALAAAFGDAADYPYESAFSAYPVTGTAASWADGEGIPAADVELTTHGDSEFDRSLRGVLAVMAWIAQAEPP